MATIFVEGFDQYGAPGITLPSLASLSLPQGGWTPIGGFVSLAIIPSLNGNAGYAIQIGGSANVGLLALSKTLPNNFTRLIGGVRILATSGLSDYTGVLFGDDLTTQCSIGIIPVSGNIGIFLGSFAVNPGPPTLIQRSVASVAGNTEHYLEWDVTFGVGVAGGWTIWLDGVQIMSSTGTTVVTSNNFSNVFQVGVNNSGPLCSVDDLYLFDSTTSFNNAVLLSNPVVLTDVPIAAGSLTGFTNIGNVVGNTDSVSGNSINANGNSLWLMPVTPAVACTLASVAVQLNSSSGNDPTAQFRSVIYADSAGVPGALLQSGNTQTGFTSGELLILPLSTTQALTASTQYWIGFINDTTVPVQVANVVGVPYRFASNTFSSGPPATAPAVTNGSDPVFMYGLCTGSAANWNSVAVLPPVGDASSVSTATASTSDLYTFPGLPTNVTAVYTVSVSGNCRLDQSGARLFDLLAKSGATTGHGSHTNIPPTVSYAWYDSLFDTDPNTGTAWTKTTADNATYGIELVT